MFISQEKKAYTVEQHENGGEQSSLCVCVPPVVTYRGKRHLEKETTLLDNKPNEKRQKERETVTPGE